jgi:adenine-specific DNA-methyltransferase
MILSSNARRAPCAALLERVEHLRASAAGHGDAAHRSALGQFFTPLSVARFMASQIGDTDEDVTLLDPGAGFGILAAAAVAELLGRPAPPRSLRLTLYEIDDDLLRDLSTVLRLCGEACRAVGVSFVGEVLARDFIADVVRRRLEPCHNVVITNPPYRKLNNGTPQREYLRALGVEVNNLYAGFLMVASRLMTKGGELVAITPRSFCSGPYFRRFRQDFLDRVALSHVHLYDSRDSTFAADAVLQENIIFRAVRTRHRTPVVITASAEPGAAVRSQRLVSFESVVRPGDSQGMWHLVADDQDAALMGLMDGQPARLCELGLEVSTGRVVPFRAAAFLRATAADGTVPLLYPQHVSRGHVSWPMPGGPRPNALLRCAATEALLVPNGPYVLVRRLSAKEEARRVVAVVHEATTAQGPAVAFENHLNYFHSAGGPLGRELAYGLAAYLNSDLVDRCFRLFNGHTQVNATDLRYLRYPTLETMTAHGAELLAAAAASAGARSHVA